MSVLLYIMRVRYRGYLHECVGDDEPLPMAAALQEASYLRTMQAVMNLPLQHDASIQILGE